MGNICERFLWLMPESGTLTHDPFALARTLSHGHTPVPERKGEECPRRRGSRVDDQRGDFLIEIRVLHSHYSGYEVAPVEWRLRGGNRTLLVKHSSARIVFRWLVRPVKWCQRVNGGVSQRQGGAIFPEGGGE